jgi:undecaprenyl diphosphate synthase
MPSFSSSTSDIPQVKAIPRHIAVIMDGNGRWAKQRTLPRAAGHKRGVEIVREVVKACSARGVEFLTLFAFSSENWRRPAEEVSMLKQLFIMALEREAEKLHRNGIRLRVVGDILPFGQKINELVERAETLTQGNQGMTLTIAANYGGRWDLLQAMQRLIESHPEQHGAFTEEQLAACLSMAYAPEPDLFIRTGGEQRISNFLLWQLAYSEFYFTDTLWPDFDSAALELAISSYQQRERRFGRTSEQVVAAAAAPAPKRELV